MPASPQTISNDKHYDVVVIGSGFGSMFFLERLLQLSPQHPRVLILEHGQLLTHGQQLQLRKNSEKGVEHYIRTPPHHKPWNFTIGFGGGTLCWWGQTPRMHPSDFELATRYGVGRDWPLNYTTLEPYYCDAEDLMQISGDSHRTGPYTRSRNYPLPPHVPSDVDRRMRELYANQLPLPTARTSETGESRPRCCATGTCNLCPLDAKFTALNGFKNILEKPNIFLETEAEVKALDASAGNITAAIYEKNDELHTVQAGLFVLGANSIFNTAILERSGLKHPVLGKGINEQVGYHVEAHFENLSGINGSTSATGMYVGLNDGVHRKTVGASTVFFDNRLKYFGLRKEYEKMMNKILLVVNAEDLPQPENHVEVPEDWNSCPIVHHKSHSTYGEAGITLAIEKLPELLAPLGLEEISAPVRRKSESHIQGTTPMGFNSEDSVVDQNQIHHTHRNLVVVGTSVFPTCPTANPSLTAAALSLRAASQLLGKQEN